MTYEELNEIVNQLEDYRDKVIIMLVFDGFYKDIDMFQTYTHEDLIIDNAHQRYFLQGRKISGTTARVINKSQMEQEIHTFSQFNKGLDLLIPSNHILRERQGFIAKMLRDDEFNGFAMNRNSVLNRFAKVKKHYGLEFNMSSLFASGCIHRAKLKIGDIENNRVAFLDYLEKTEEVSRAMGYLYFKYYLEMKERMGE